MECSDHLECTCVNKWYIHFSKSWNGIPLFVKVIFVIIITYVFAPHSFFMLPGFVAAWLIWEMFLILVAWLTTRSCPYHSSVKLDYDYVDRCIRRYEDEGLIIEPEFVEILTTNDKFERVKN